MKLPITNPVHWRLDTLLSFGTEEIHELARAATGTLTSYRLVLGRCLLALHHTKGYKEHGCSSAIHYGILVLGLSPRTARVCRRVAKRLRHLPELTLAAERGTIAWSKLREIVRKATPETELFWLKLAATKSYKEMELLVRRTAKGCIPGEVGAESVSGSSELRCSLSPEVFAMLERARRMFSLEKGEAVTSADVLEWALASYIASQPVDPETLEKVRQDTDKDLQAERARQMPLVSEARELAEEMCLLGDGDAQESENMEEDPLIQALGARCSARVVSAEVSVPTILADETTNHGAEPSPKRPARTESDNETWHNSRLRFNPKTRHTSKAQKKELLRRDGWCCRTPGCPNNVWLHMHHLKPYSQGGPTEPRNLACLCTGCHGNLHRGLLRITPTDNDELVFCNADGQRLDRQADLELAGWLDFWLGWSGQEKKSHSARAHKEQWKVFAA